MSFLYGILNFLRRLSPLSLGAPMRKMAKEELLGLIKGPDYKIVMITITRNDHKGLMLNEAKRALTTMTGQFHVVQLDEYADFHVLHESLVKLTGVDLFPYVFVKGDYVAGGMEKLTQLSKSGVLEEWLKDHQYDLVVIGGGSGGLAAAKAAAGHGKKVAVLDYVDPTPKGTTWGLGGTCVNVGCIPKKLMHQASILGKSVEDAKKFGWNLPEEPTTHNWETMKQAIQDHIGSLNWGYRVQLREKSVTYLNSRGSFIDSHSIRAVNKKGKEDILTADKILLATGLRPKYLDCPGAKEFCITSDDLFSLDYNPGKTLCVGASYVSLECGGFLRGIGLDVTVMVRSILLRGFDQDMAERIGKHMEDHGIKFIREAIPIKIEQITEGKPGLLRVTAKQGDTEIVEEYNTVLLAIGREALTDTLNLEKVGVLTNKSNKKIQTVYEQSSVPHIYAIGDILDGKQELTPVAIHAGRLLAARMAGKSDEQCDYQNVPTTVFTPLEYGCCGLSEEDAIKLLGEDNVEIFHDLFEPLEQTVPKRDPGHSYAKIICNKADNMRVIGFHYLGPNAGEVTQGFGIALKLKATKADFDSLIGIHPTCAEVFTNLVITKSSDVELKPGGC